MSIIHRALKKAEQDQMEPDTMSGVSIDIQEEDSEGSSMRKYILMGLVVASLMVVGYFRFYKNQAGPMTMASLPVTTQAPAMPVVTSNMLPVPAAAPTEAVSDNGLNTSMSTTDLTESGIKKMQSGDYEEAKKLFETVVVRDPRNAEAYNNYGLALKKLGKNEEAFEQYRKALAINADFAECINNLGVLYMVNRNLPEAENQFSKSMQLKPDYADPYLHMGMVLEARGDPTGAKRNYQLFVEKARGIGADTLVKVQNRIASLKIQ